jgi:hypothetical protein
MRRSARLLAVVSVLITYLFPLMSIRADTLNVTATVPAQASNYTALLTSSATGEPFGPGKELAYTITYGTNLAYDTPVTIVASWSQAVPQGAPSPSVDVLSYVAGSATNAVNSTPPVIDTLNRTISWHIAALAGNASSKTVSFRLQTSSTFTAADVFSFQVSGELQGPGVTTAPSTLEQTFYNPPIPVMPLPTATPTPSTVPVSRLTPTAVPVPAKLTLQTVEVRSIAPDSATIFVQTSLPSSLTLPYGENQTALSQEKRSNTFSSTQLLQLDGLLPQTRYYFRVVAATKDGQTVTSEVYTFVTAAQQVSFPSVMPESFVATSGNTILEAPLGTEESLEAPLLVLPQTIPYNFRISIINANAATKVQAFVRTKSTHLTIANLDLLPLAKGLYRGGLHAPTQPGRYELVIRLQDQEGMVTETPVAQLNVVHPFMVLSAQTGQPLPESKVLFSFFNTKTQRYELITPALLAIQNPQYANDDGSLPVVLPAGKYQVVISDLSYQEQTVHFTIGPSSGYPLVKLQKQPFSLSNSLDYFQDSYQHVVHDLIGSFLAALFGSPRALYLSALVSLSCLAVLTFLSFSARTRIPLSALPASLRYHGRLFFHPHEGVAKLQGTVRDEKRNPLQQVAVFIRSDQNGRIIGHTITNSTGMYSLILHQTSNYWISLFKEGYPPFSAFQSASDNQLPLNVTLMAHESPQTLLLSVKNLSREVLGLLFELLLLSSLGLQLAIGLKLGFGLVIWFFLLSLCNLTIWLIYLHNQQSLRT